MKKKYFLKILVLFIGLFLFNINQVNALSFNEKAEDFWGYWAADNSTTLKNTSSYTYRCEKVSDPNSLVAINNNGGCALTSQDVFTNQDVKIKIIRTSKGGTETSVPKTLKMRANAVRIHAPLRIGDKYNAGADFKRLGLKVYSGSKAFTTIPTSVLKTGTLGTYNFEAIAVGAGNGVLQLRSISGINFRAHLSVWKPENKTVNVNTELLLTNDTGWCSFSPTQSSVKTGTYANATLISRSHSCYFKATSAGTFTAYDIKGRYAYKYTITVTNPSGTNTKETNYVISINRDGGNLGSSDFTYASDGGIGSYTYTKKTTANSITVKLPTTGTKSGYTFGGIYTNSSCNGTKMGSSATISSTEQYKTYYACWIKNSVDPSPKPNTNSNTVKPYQTPTVDVPVQNKIKTDIYDYRYVGDYDKATFQGYTVSCGDRVFVTTCDESTDSNSTCNIGSLNGVKISGTKVYRQKLKESEPACSSIERYSQMGATYYTAAALIGKTNDEKKLPCASLIIFKETPTKSCVYGPAVSNSTDNFAKQYCKVSYKNEEIFVDRSKIGISKPVCAEEEPKKEETAPPKKQTQSVVDCPAVLPIKNSKSHEKHPLPVCYTYENGEYTVKGKDVKEMFTCSKGYRRIIEESLEQNTCSKLKNTKEQQTCYKTFIYSCLSISKPKVSGTGSAATPEQLGTLSIKGYDSDTNTGLEGYIINNGSKPTVNPDEWTEFPNLEYEDTKTMTSGSYFIWTMTNDNSISYPILLTIKDDDISTTVSDIKISSSNGAINHSYNPIQSDDSTAYNQEVSSSNYVRLSNQLADKSVVASGFDLFKTAYELNVDSNQIAIYATLTNKDSNYVEGYEPRTVDLDYGRNVVLIKIVNKNNKERTYTFIINRSDNRESINTLKSLTTSLGNLNFDPHISDYTISVPKNAKSVNINGTLDSSKSSFIKGYEPRRIDLTNDITSAALKTISEAGIARNYILTFIKTGASISNDISKSTYLSSLTIPGTEIIFDRDTLNYTVSTPYEIQNLPVFALPESENATVEINGNQDLKVGANRVEIIITNDNLMKIYTIFINRKEDGLEISSNTKLETLTIKDYDLKFIEDVYDYTVKIKREKTLLLSATPQSDRAEVYMYGNNDLTTFSTIRVKVIAENGDTGLYSIDIIKDIYNKKFETTVAIIASMILLSGTIIVIINKKRKKLKDYIEG